MEYDAVILIPPLNKKYDALSWAFQCKKPFAILLPFTSAELVYFNTVMSLGPINKATKLQF